MYENGQTEIGDCRTAISELQNNLDLKEEELRNLKQNLEGNADGSSPEDKQNELIM